MSEYVSDRISVGDKSLEESFLSQPQRILQLRNHSP